jgi:hypothetical protein
MENGNLLASATTHTSRRSDEEKKAKKAQYAREWRERNPNAHLLRDREKSARYRAKNKDAIYDRCLAWRQANPEKIRGYSLKYKFGITPEEQDALLVSQGSVCAICATDTPTKVGWHTDHCHETKAVRGILCHHCNVMLGMARDNPETLLKAAEYLGK